MDKVERSILANSMIKGRVIPNGIDISVFHSGNKQLVRAQLGIPQDVKVLLLAANGIRENVWKDYQTMRTALAMLAERMKEDNLLFIGLGENGSTEYINRAKVQFVPFQKDPRIVARYFQAADAYVHAAKVDTFPNTVLESFACGTPVVATAVGGIPEQVQDGMTGFLVPLGNAEQMATSIQKLLENPELQQKMSAHAAKVARQEFTLERMVDNYLNWFQEILTDRKPS
jgi:glycosyltransferase involved in cell wall biosynthesis